MSSKKGQLASTPAHPVISHGDAPTHATHAAQKHALTTKRNNGRGASTNGGGRNSCRSMCQPPPPSCVIPTTVLLLSYRAMCREGIWELTSA